MTASQVLDRFLYPVPSGKRRRPARIRLQSTQVRAHRLYLLLDAPIDPALNPSPDLLEHPLSRIELWTVRRLRHRRQADGLHQQTPVSSSAVPHQRLHLRTSLQSADRRHYPIRLHRVYPAPQQPPASSVHHTEQVHPLVHRPRSLARLHSTTPPHPARRSTKTNSHLVGKAQLRLPPHSRAPERLAKSPLFQDSRARRSAFSWRPRGALGEHPSLASRLYTLPGV